MNYAPGEIDDIDLASRRAAYMFGLLTADMNELTGTQGVFVIDVLLSGNLPLLYISNNRLP